MRICNYILGKMENYNNKAAINPKNYTIEHIMPQNKNLKQEWKDALGYNWQEIQKTYIHTIGNLTLTAYNSEMSDEPFNEKLEMTGGFKESALRINSYVVKQTTWNEDTIKERADLLKEKAFEIWKYPSLSEQELAPFIGHEQQEAEYTLDQFEYLTGDMLQLFNLLDKRIHNISSDVKREIKKLYIAYKADTNFVDIVPQKSRLRLSLNMKFSEIDDPKQLCKDVTEKGRWGNGDIEVGLDNENQIDDVMNLIMQSFNSQMN